MGNLLTHKELIQKAQELARDHRSHLNELEKIHEETKRLVDRSRELLSESLRYLRPNVGGGELPGESDPIAGGEETDDDPV